MIGFFDSGVGGLGVLAEARPLLPDADVVYLADQAHAPYGLLSLDEVRALAEAAAGRLIGAGAETVVVACNTASAAALEVLRRDHPGVRFVGMEPAVKPAVAATRSGVVGVLATPTTFTSPVLDDLIGRFSAGVRVLAHPCPGWAEAVEDGTGDAEGIERHLQPLLAEGVDTLVLACTHYSFLRDAIAAGAPETTVIDPAAAVARQLARVADPSGSGLTTYLTTGDPVRFAGQIERLIGAVAEPAAVA